jgi:hypothetical protein
VGLYEIRCNDGMLPVDQTDALWVTCFLDEEIPQTDVEVPEGRNAQASRWFDIGNHFGIEIQEL